ncbi:MbnP family protein [Sphingobacterium sp. SYP-B4668]|uniref:MbnP family protein n=1 Tax=Sphingobacterium sp. SYP-B4668 TaxID=2996035 RepID=UPI0022DE53EE|nr:MbnP family protein [Sphingobacterium sp. SYP-B4668]
MKKQNLFFAAIAALVFTSCDKTEIKEVEKIVYADQAGSLSLTFDARYGDSDFELNKKYPYQLTSSGGTYDLEFDFSRLRYWVSNVKLVDNDNKEHELPDSYYLVEETNEIAVPHLINGEKYPATKREEVTIKDIPSGEYKAIKFSIGVDQKYNDNIALTAGELGSLNGMGVSDGWMWFTSYKFLTLAGTIHWADGTPTSKALSWETGSNELFDGAEKTVELATPLKIDARNSGKIIFNVDVKELLSATDLPWVNNSISQRKKDLMIAVRDAFLGKSLTFKEAGSVSVEAN